MKHIVCIAKPLNDMYEVISLPLDNLRIRKAYLKSGDETNITLSIININGEKKTIQNDVIEIIDICDSHLLLITLHKAKERIKELLK